LLALFSLACGDGRDPPEDAVSGAEFTCSGSGSRFATAVTEYEFGSGQDFGQAEFPAPVLGPPRGGGSSKGSLDVTSIGEGGFVTLEFESNVIVDGPGADVIVFENAFTPDAPEDVFAELGSVSLSQDGASFTGYECQAASYPYEGCAGWQPVLANTDENDIDPLDPDSAGGDAFDLAELGLAWARYVRIEDMPDDEADVRTFDLDAAAIVNAGCP
jgi:hypothetical protein